jgi:hypothetical protein
LGRLRAADGSGARAAPRPCATRCHEIFMKPLLCELQKPQISAHDIRYEMSVHVFSTCTCRLCVWALFPAARCILCSLAITQPAHDLMPGVWLVASRRVTMHVPHVASVVGFCTPVAGNAGGIHFIGNYCIALPFTHSAFHAPQRADAPATMPAQGPALSVPLIAAFRARA